MEKVAELAERLNEAIKDKTSTTKLADQIGMSKQAISAYATGVRVPKRPVINALAEALGINPLWLMGYDVGKYNNVTATIPAGFQPLPQRDRVPRVGQIACGGQSLKRGKAAALIMDYLTCRSVVFSNLFDNLIRAGSRNEQGFTRLCFNLCAICLLHIGQYWPII